MSWYNTSFSLWDCWQGTTCCGITGGISVAGVTVTVISTSSWTHRGNVQFGVGINYPNPETNSEVTPENGWLEYVLVSFWGLFAYFQGRLLFVSGRVILKPPTLSPFTADFAQWLMVDNWNILNAVESWVEFGFFVSIYLLSTDECSETKWREHIGVEEFFTNNSLEAIRWCLSLRVSHVSSKNYNNCCTCLWPFLSSSFRENPVNRTTSSCKQRSKLEAQNNWLIG